MPGVSASFRQMSSYFASWAASSPALGVSHSAHEYVIVGPSTSR